VQRYLRGLAARAGEESERYPSHDSPHAEGLDGKGARLLEDLRVLSRPEGRDDAEDREREAEVADAVRDESLARGVARLLAVEVVAYEKVRAEAHALPPDEHHHEVRSHHEHEHREHEEAEVCEEAVEASVAVHVAGGEDEDAEAHAGHYEHEDGRERVELIAPLDIEHGALPVLLRHVRDGDEHALARPHALLPTFTLGLLAR